MKDIWYADNRDVVKWAVLCRLAEESCAKAIVQVLFLRKVGPPRIECRIGGLKLKEFPVDNVVWTHFRRPSQVRALGTKARFNVRPFTRPYDPKQRDVYLGEAVNYVKKQRPPKVVLLDPDTGLSRREPSAKHITERDVRRMWKTLGNRDWLALYQHSWRAKRWLETARERFSRACSGAKTYLYRGVGFAGDAVILAARRQK